ncbi:hypothetical protein OGATHE_003118 [Ogataea polymorpha]|uniref:Uncharacterized protein n=1 Tax=Ogataea polymorpha TaxID=460523 RepID=A0A9P8T6Z0_9ASCO|nr:hypothetical protein OGATHE_003118 [Ogataea polymorpha]
MLKIVGIPRLARTGATLAIPWWKAGAKRKHSRDDATIPGTLLLSTLCSLTPRLVMRSPAPEVDVDALPPCLLTLSPIPAPTMAADVETLKVFWPSPPVPTTSM